MQSWAISNNLWSKPFKFNVKIAQIFCKIPTIDSFLHFHADFCGVRKYATVRLSPSLQRTRLTDSNLYKVTPLVERGVTLYKWLIFSYVCFSRITGQKGNVILDQAIRLMGQKTRSKYPIALRRIVYYSPEHKRTFTFLTNNFTLKAETIAFLYKNRWLVECFFKWIKSHLRVNSFWGTTENAVRIQIYVAIITFCLVAIIEHDLRLNRSTFDVLRIIGASLLSKEPLRDLLEPAQPDPVCQMAEPQLFENFN